MAQIILRNIKIGSSWTPEKIKSSLVFWYDPSDSKTITTSGPTVIRVLDKSENNHNLTVSTAGKTGPKIGTRKVNGLNVFEYDIIDPNGQVLENNTFSYNQATSPLIIAMLVKCDVDNSDGDTDFFFSGTESTSDRLGLRRSNLDTIQVIGNGNTVSITTPSNSFPEGQEVLVVAKFNATNSSLRINGGSFTSTGNVGTSLFTSINVGTNEAEALSIEGYIAEIVAFNDPTKQEIVEGYLTHKWGLSNVLPSSHPYKSERSIIYTPRVILNKPTDWTPSRISTSLWLDAQDGSTITQTGSNVSQWKDKSGNNRNAIQSTTSFQPLYQILGISNKPSILFNGVDQRLSLESNILITEEMSVFSVLRRSTSGIWSVDIGGNLLNARPHGFIWGTTNFLYNGLGAGGTVDDVIVGNSTGSGNFIVQTVRSNLLGNVGAKVRLNGSQFGVTKQPLAIGGELALIGRRPNQTHNGLLGEIIVINEYITEETKLKMEGYLAHKWSLTSLLPVGHPYKTETPKI